MSAVCDLRAARGLAGAIYPTSSVRKPFGHPYHAGSSKSVRPASQLRLQGAGCLHAGTSGRSPQVCSRAVSLPAPQGEWLPIEYAEFGEVDELHAELPFDLQTQHEFLEKYWQKRPLLIRQACPGYVSPLQPEELAGLACERGIASRMVLAKGGVQPWEMRYGPFTEESFTSLPETDYSFLVQGVDRHVPQVSKLLDLFPFIPRWRFDDVQVQPGTVGPHSDNFDVFLLQSDGTRSWAVSTDPKYDVDRLDVHEEPQSDVSPVVRILKDWVPQFKRVLRPGDALYLPPKVAHHGITLDPGFTYSVGFLAPKHQELVTSYVNTLSAETDYFMDRWEDPWLTRQEYNGDIQAASLDAAEEVLKSLLRDRATLARWFGVHVTQPQGGPEARPLDEAMGWEEFHDVLRTVGEVHLLESMRSSFIAGEEVGLSDKDYSGIFFVNGQATELSDPDTLQVARMLASSRRITAEQMDASGTPVSATLQEFVLSLVNQGILYFLDEEDGELIMMGDDEDDFDDSWDDELAS